MINVRAYFLSLSALFLCASLPACSAGDAGPDALPDDVSALGTESATDDAASDEKLGQSQEALFGICKKGLKKMGQRCYIPFSSVGHDSKDDCCWPSRCLGPYAETHPQLGLGVGNGVSYYCQ